MKKRKKKKKKKQKVKLVCFFKKNKKGLKERDGIERQDRNKLDLPPTQPNIKSRSLSSPEKKSSDCSVQTLFFDSF